MPKPADTVFWSLTPRSDRCCLCAGSEGPFVAESRPTGPNRTMQAWPYCPGRWDLYQRPDPIEPAVAGMCARRLIAIVLDPESEKAYKGARQAAVTSSCLPLTT